MESQLTDDRRRARVISLVMGLAFFFSILLSVSLAKWIYAAFYSACLTVVLLGKRLDRLPKPVRYLVLAAFAALCVATFVKLILDAQALR